MKKYLKMSDFVVGKVQLAFNRNFDVCVSYDCADPDMLARKTMDAMEHAINSHDELVAMNKELLAALGVIAASGEFQGDSFVCDFETLQRVAHDAIAKAKAAS